MAKEAYEWYEKQQPGLGELFLKELDRCYGRISVSPALHAKIYNDFRQIIFAKFPYVLVFEVIKDEVVVYVVFHTSRNPKRKFKKD